jgi:hypothetical protein
MATASAEAMETIRRLAGQCPGHRLAPDMVNGIRPLSEAAASAVILRLEGLIARRGGDSRETPAPPAPAGIGSRPPGLPPSLVTFKDIPPGYYATPSRTGNNDFDFWRVDPGKGKWEGFRFAVRLLGGDAEPGEMMRTVPLENVPMRLALQAIAEYGIEEAGAKFAELLVRCRDCGRFLTDQVSRDEGRGPVCRAK